MPEFISAFRGSALEFMRQGKPDLAIVSDLCEAAYFYTPALEMYGINPVQFEFFRPAMEALKVWIEACFLAGDAEHVACAKDVLADVEETASIITAYEVGVLEEARREARLLSCWGMRWRV